MHSAIHVTPQDESIKVILRTLLKIISGELPLQEVKNIMHEKVVHENFSITKNNKTSFETKVGIQEWKLWIIILRKAAKDLKAIEEQIVVDGNKALVIWKWMADEWHESIHGDLKYSNYVVARYVIEDGKIVKTISCRQNYFFIFGTDISEAYLQKSYQKALGLDKNIDGRNITKDSENSDQRQLTNSLNQHNIAKDTLASVTEKDVGEERFVKPDEELVAIVGMAGTLPGAEDVDEFWQNLINKTELISSLPRERWQSISGVHSNYEGDVLLNNYASLVKAVDKFDASFFGFSKEEAQLMDPQHRLILHVVYQAIEDSAYKPDEFANSRTAIFIGSQSLDYKMLYQDTEQKYETMAYMGMESSMLTNRVARYLNCTGPCQTINAECASALLAIHNALQLILDDKVDKAIVGAVNLLLHPYGFVVRDKAGVLSHEKQPRPFGKNSQGYIRGEGAGAFILKRLDKAKRDNDNILAVIRGSAINQSENTLSLIAPHLVSQTSVILKAWENAKLDPTTLSYIEANANGIEVSDGVEINAIKNAFKTAGVSREPTEKIEKKCAISTLKAQIGHLEAASGVSSLIKVIKSFENNLILSIKGLDELSLGINLNKSPLFICDSDVKWEKTLDAKGPRQPRRAGINSFSIGGTNAHLVIEEYLPEQASEQPQSITYINHQYLIPLSAKSENALGELAKRYLNYFKGEQTAHLRDIAYTLQCGRDALNFRLAFIVSDRKELLDKLNAYIAGQESSDYFYNGPIKNVNTLTLQTQASLNDNQLNKNWSEGKNLESLARLWVKGGTVDWSILYAEQDCKKISLPSYPFEKASYWLPGSIGLTAGGSQLSQHTVIHQSFSPKIVERKLESKGQLPTSNVDLVRDIDSRVFKQKTIEKLKQLFSDQINVPKSEIDALEILGRYGINSLMIVALNHKLTTIFGEISKTLFFEYQTLDALADYFIERYFHECVSWTHSDNVQGRKHRQKYNSVALEKNRGDTSKVSSTISDSAHKKQEVQRNSLAEPIAIIGLSGSYPQADSLDEFWRNLKAGKDCITELPEDRWSLDGFFNKDPDEAIAERKSYGKWGSFLDGFAYFDSLFFNISPKEAMKMDPQERLFLQASWEVLEDAGYTRETLRTEYQQRVGVFAGITKTGFDLYGPELWRRGEKLYPRTSFSSVANRVSYVLDLKGPSMPIDTMCSASLTAIHEACEHLTRDDCKLAIAGGVNLYLHPANYIELSAHKMLSVDGRCKTFGKGGNGFVPGEGVGVVLLKRLSQAVADKDQIHAIIRATHVNHGGKTNGYTVPSPSAQTELIRDTLEKANIDARSVSYVEAHGTGTELGDPIEVEGLTQAFRKDTETRQFCAIGSIKSNIGHLEAAAGIAGLTKIILQMKHGMLVPSLHSAELNPNIQFEKTPFVVQQKASQWRRELAEGVPLPKIACISSFGAGGSNAHAVIEEFISDPVTQHNHVIDNQNEAVVITLSAQNKDRLHEVARRLLEFINQFKSRAGNSAGAKLDLHDLSYTLQVGREAMEERLGLIVSSIAELKQKLTKLVDDEYLKKELDVEDIGNVCRGQVKKNKEALAMEDEDLREAVDKWIKGNKLTRLLSLWVKGLSFDWNKLYADKKPQRISLPTYPFAKERYWWSEEGVSPTLLESVKGTGTDEYAEKSVTPLTQSVSGHTDQASKRPPANSLDVSAVSQGAPFHLDDYLRQLVSDQLQIPVKDIELDQALDDYGLDSIGASQLLQKLTAKFTDIPQSLFLEHSTLGEISDYIQNHHAADLSALNAQKSVANEQITQPTQATPVTETKVVSNPIDEGAATHSGVHIIGMAGRFCDANTIDEFLANLRNEKTSLKTLPSSRYQLLGLSAEVLADKVNQVGGYLDDIAYFDPALFKISAKDAKAMDPQLRKLLEVTWQAILDAGYRLGDFRKYKTGLFVATKGHSGYQAILGAQGSRMEPPSAYANRLSNILNIKGPSEIIETGCSSFLVAIKHALSAMQAGRCEQAIVATAELSLSPDDYLKEDPLGLYSQKNCTKSFAAGSDGYVKSEAIGAIVLKLAERSQHDGDPVYATIKGVGVCHGGKAPLRWYSPNIEGQRLAIEEALAEAHIDPATVSYIEPEANGSRLGDVSEIIALQSVYGPYLKAKSSAESKATIHFGSVKPLIGHAEAASTFPVLLKLIDAMGQQTLPKVAGLGELNDGIQLDENFEILRDDRAWDRRVENGVALPRRAAIHSLSVGGVNAHLILEEYENDPAAVALCHAPERTQFIFIFSDKTPAQLRTMMGHYLAYLANVSEPTPTYLQRLEYTLQRGRESHKSKLVVLASTLAQLCERIEGWLDGVDVARGGNANAVEKGVYCSEAITTTQAQQNLAQASQANQKNKQDLRAQLSAWLDAASLDKLALAWLAGHKIDWQPLHSEGPMQKLHLPPNQLARVFCWHEGFEEEGIAPKTQASRQERTQDHEEQYFAQDKHLKEEAVSS